MPFDTSHIILPFSAGLSGVVEVCSTHWLDRIKTEMQKNSLDGKNGSFGNAAKSIYSTNGYYGFYTGIGPRLIGIIPMRCIYWSTLTSMNHVVEKKPFYIQYTIPGLVAGSVQTLVDNPIEVAKIKLMTKEKQVSTITNNEINSKFSGKFSSIIKIRHNLQNMYVGFVSCLYRNSIFAVIVGSFVKKYGQKQEHKFFAGAVGGLIGGLVSHPFDVVKTELQRYKTNIAVDNPNITTNKSNNSTFKIMFNIAKKNPMNLWSGATMRCTLGFFNMGIGFYALGFIQNYCKGLFC